MSANVEDSMDVDEENMQVDEDNAVLELPMSTDEDSAQDTGGVAKITDVAMASDGNDVENGDGLAALSNKPLDVMESENLTEEPPVSFIEENADDDSLYQEVEGSVERANELDPGSLCQTEIDPTSDNPNETDEAGIGTALHRTSATELSEEQEGEKEQEIDNPSCHDETSQNNEDPLNSGQNTEFELAGNSNITGVISSADNSSDPFAHDGSNSGVPDKIMNTSNEESATAENSSESRKNTPTAEPKSLADELNEQLNKDQENESSGKDKRNDDDHISIDDTSSAGGGVAETADHVSLDESSEGDPTADVDHVSVDSDSDVGDGADDKVSSPNKDPGNQVPVIQTIPVDDDERETPASQSDSSMSANSSVQLVVVDAQPGETVDKTIQNGDKTSEAPSKPNTVDLLESDDENAAPTTPLIRPKSSEALKSHITLIGKAADTETIISDVPTSTRTATIILNEAKQGGALNSSPSKTSEPTVVIRDTANTLKSKSTYSVKKINNAVQWKCLHCSSYKKCPWKVTIGESDYFICNDKCMEGHRAQRKQMIESGSPPVSHIQIANASNLKKKCALCFVAIPKNKLGSLTWEVMNFCDEDCLSKFQSTYTSKCCNCQASVTTAAMGKYCVRFGHEVKQFCTAVCLDTYKKVIKTCSYCQKNLQDSSGGFLAVAGGKDQFRDFCSQSCLEKYDCICNNSMASFSVDNCIVCDNVKVTQYELLSSIKVAKLCSDVCLAAYKFVNNIEVGICGMCNKYYDKSGEEFVTFNHDIPTPFCSKHCMNINVISKRKIVPCAWCKAKKYNFDMIYRNGSTEEDGLFVCSVNCLALHNVSTKAFPSIKVACCHCKKLDLCTYHITMSDASIRHFCSYECVLSFQSSFNLTTLGPNVPVPEGSVKKVARPSEVPVSTSSSPTASSSQTVGSVKSSDSTNPAPQTPQGTSLKVKQTTLKIPASLCYKPPEMKNKWTQITVCKSAKCVSCHPKKGEQNIQCDLGVGQINGEVSDSAKEKGDDSTSITKAVVPVPVPVYIPYPVPMSVSAPVAIPIPIPVIIPIILPTSLENMDRVLETMKEIVEKSMKEATADQPNAVDGVPSKKSVLAVAGDKKKRALDESDDDCGPSKRVRIDEEDPLSPGISVTPEKMKLIYTLGPDTWKHFAKTWNESIENHDDLLKLNVLSMRPHELSRSLTKFVGNARKPNGDELRADVKFYLCLGIQYHLFENGRVDDIFGDTTYEDFTDALDLEARKFNSSITVESAVSRVEEEHLWESTQLGAKSPQVLLMTLMYFITIHFNLWTLDEHMRLSFNSFSIETESATSDRPHGVKVVNLVLTGTSEGGALKKPREFQFRENKKDIMRCPVRLYEFYLTKCPGSVLTHSDRFYLTPETSCVPESPVWYRTVALSKPHLEKMLNRVKMIKEIRESMLRSSDDNLEAIPSTSC